MAAPLISMSDPIYEQIEKNILQTYTNTYILWIESCSSQENKLAEAYNTYKSTLRNPNEKQLFHGTSEYNARQIIYEGFRPDFSKRNAYGKGVYFSTRAVYSRDYSTETGNGIAFLLVCNICTGKVEQGMSGQEISEGYDSATDSRANPDMYIVNRSDACLPVYLVAFYPSAK